MKALAARVLGHGSGAAPDARLAPHLAPRLVDQAGAERRTTLDIDVQRVAADALARHIGSSAAQNLRDGAVLVADADSGEIRAYVAANTATSTAPQVDGIRALRQAGSTLKPFLYGLAIERRYVTAASLLDDSPINLNTAVGLYIPQNYDRNFKGLVSVRTALASSLNVPAVRTLVLTGVERFRDRLVEAGYTGIDRDGEYYGYSLALGSAEVTLWQQVGAYRALARGGLWSQLRLFPGDPAPDRRIMDAGAAAIVADMLSDRSARVPTFGIDNNLTTRFWSAVKTGTSKDMRDNWCIGFTPRYVVGVWVGNFEGDSMHDVSGVTGAAPIWQEVISALHDDARPPAPPAGVVAADVRFEPAIEGSRRELFLDGTAITVSRALPEGGEIIEISSPANGMIVAHDPDIPANHQRIPFAARGRTDGLAFVLDGQPLGAAKGPIFWRPTPGAHRLALQSADGVTVDQVLFTVR
jgi:penicillin-binding protein 1C